MVALSSDIPGVSKILDLREGKIWDLGSLLRFDVTCRG